MVDKIKILKDTSFYSLTTYASEAINFLRGILIAALLGPTTFGIWRGLQLIPLYGVYAHLGTLNAMERQIPYYAGKKEIYQADRIRDVSLSFTLFSGFILSIGLVIYSFFLHSTDLLIVNGIRLIAIVLFLQQLWIFFTKYLNTQKQFFLKSISNLVLAVSSIIFIPLCVWFFGFTGLFLGLIVGYIITLLYMFLYCPIPFRFSLDFHEIKPLIRIGVPILIIGLLATFLSSIDRMMILKYLDVEHLGYYGIGIMFLTLVKLASRVVTEVFSPHIYERLGETGELESIKGLVIKPTYASALIFPFFLGAAFFMVPFIITTFMPAYTPGVDALKIIIVFSFFIPLNPLGMIFFIAIHKQHKLIPLTLGLIIISAALQYWFLSAGLGIMGVALAVGITTFIDSAVTLLYIFSHFTAPFWEYMVLLGKSYLPFFYFVAVLYLAQWVPLPFVISPFLVLLIRMFLLLFFSLPLLYFLHQLIPLTDLFTLWRPHHEKK